jgi:hypothetical protein
MTVHEIEQFADHEDNGGALPAYAWPGGYAMFYVTENGDTLCAACATAELNAWRVNESDDPPAAYGAFGATDDYPETPEQCDNCYAVICFPLEWREHTWQAGRLTGAVTCSACGLLPLDNGDRATECTGNRDWLNHPNP